MLARLRNPLVQLMMLYLLTMVLAIPGGAAGGLAAVAVMAVFAVANPLTIALGRSWWLWTGVSSVLFAALFGVLGATPAVREMREGAMVFLFPIMLFVGAVPVGGLVRLWRWHGARAGSAERRTSEPST